MDAEHVSIGVAFLAGMLTFFSPCLLPLVPIYIGYLGGSTAAEQVFSRRMKTMGHSVLFVLGFSFIYVAIGASVGFVGSVLSEYMPILQKVAGVIIVLLGMQLIGVIHLPLLSGEKRLQLGGPPASSYPSSFLLGLFFGFAWTPCVGPILGAISIVASVSETAWEGAFLLSVYSAGLAVPFLITAFALGSMGNHLRRLNEHLHMVSLVSGLLLVIVGALVFTGNLHRLAGQIYYSLPF